MGVRGGCLCDVQADGPGGIGVSVGRGEHLACPEWYVETWRVAGWALCRLGRVSCQRAEGGGIRGGRPFPFCGQAC